MENPNEIIKMIKEVDTRSYFKYRRELKWDYQIYELLMSVKEKEKIAVMFSKNIVKTYDFSKIGEVELKVEINKLVQDYIPLQYRVYFKNQVTMILKDADKELKEYNLNKIIERKQL